MENPKPTPGSAGDSVALTVARLALGVVIFPHGAQLALGWFGGPGFNGSMGMFTGMMHIPWIFALLAILSEFLGGILLILGLWTRLAAAAVGIVMAVAVFMVHIHVGFFMNWMGSQKGEGFEFHILAVGIALALVLGGGGRCSFDRLLRKRAQAAA